MIRFRIIRDDGISDAIAGQSFDSYNAAYAVLERYYGDLCCSDERECYHILDEPSERQSPIDDRDRDARM